MTKETAMKILKELHDNSLFSNRIALETLIPELADSNEERIRKELIDAIQGLWDNDALPMPLSVKRKDEWIAWLEKQCEQKQFYIRFGDIPEGEKSSVWRGDEFLGKENGVSVYPAFKRNGNIVLGISLPITKTTLHTQQHLLEYDNRPCYLVKGDYIGNGADGEPLIRNVEIVEEIKDFRAKEGEARYEVKAGGSLSVNGKPFDYEKATITQKDFAPKDYHDIDPHFGIPVEDLMSRKNTEKVEPKFKVGDYIVYDYCMGRVIEITNDAYLLNIGQGIPFSCEDNVHLWTIQDANEGNILAGKIDGDNYILIFKTIKDGWIETYGHYYNAVNRFCVPSQLFCRDYQGTFTPATKEQRELLFQKMKEAGYQWDAEKKELKKINSYCQENCKGYQETVEDISNGKNMHTDVKDWLKSLKECNTWKPSKKQMETLEYYMHTLLATEHKEVLFGLYNDLKKL